jgi:hypothetical protein
VDRVRFVQVRRSQTQVKAGPNAPKVSTREQAINSSKLSATNAKKMAKVGKMARAMESEKQDQMVGVTSLPSDAIKRVVLRLSAPHLQQGSQQPAPSKRPEHTMHASMSGADAFRFAMSPVRDHVPHVPHHSPPAHHHEVTVSPPSKSPYPHKHNAFEGSAYGHGGHGGMRPHSPTSIAKIYNINTPHGADSVRPYEGSSSSGNNGYGSSGYAMSMRAHSDDPNRRLGGRSPTRSPNKKSSKTSASRGSGGDEEDDFSYSVVEPSLRMSNKRGGGGFDKGCDKGIAGSSSSDAGAHAAFKVSRCWC